VTGQFLAINKKETSMTNKRWFKQSGQWALAACALGVSAISYAAPPTAAMLGNACAGCHGTNGGSEEGKEGKDDTPAMASQWLTYLQMQMALYLNDQRKMPEKMKEKVQGLTTEELESLLHFYASVK
jgi:cytochrome c553